MKRVLSFLTIICSLLLICSCGIEESNEKVTLIAPSGAPTFAIADALSDTEIFDYNIVAGADALQAAFINADYDIIVAPVNLGATFMQKLTDFSYVYYKTLVGGCFYLVTSEDINDIKELNGKSITAFGANSTPDIVLKSLIKYYNLDVEINYVNDVSIANNMLVSGKATTIISAEPSISKFNKTNKYKTISLQEEWKKISDSSYNIPQAGIFVKKSVLNNTLVNKALRKINTSASLAYTDAKRLASQAILVDGALEKIGEEILTIAAPRCNFIVNNYQKEEVVFYFNKLIELGLREMIGGTLPSEEFYY